MVLRGKADITDDDKGMRAAIERLDVRGQEFVDIGILADAGEAEVEKAAQNEFGTERIPERSFIRATIDENEDRLARARVTLSGRIADGQLQRDAALRLMGVRIQTMIRRKIRTLRTPPNAPATIAKKGSDNPLIDTGEMLRRVTFRVGEDESGGE